MDLNMIKGLGPAFRQTMYKSGVNDVEQLVKILPSKIDFFVPVKLNTIVESSYVTLEITVLTYNEGSDSAEKINFTVRCDDIVINASIESKYYYRKQLMPGKKFKIRGFFDVNTKCIDVESLFDIDSKIFQTSYEVGDLPSSQINNFTEKGLTILNEYSNEMPSYINKKIGISSYSDILNDIHMPKSSDIFVKALKNYTYEIIFNFFTSYYYYIMSTSTQRTEENAFDSNKINSYITSNATELNVNQKKVLNELLKEYKRGIYTNIVVENYSEIDKKIISLISIISKVSMKKQIIIVTKENFEFYTNLKEELLNHNIKVDIMARKGRNKENFESFNSGKYDVLVTPPVNFDTLNTQSVGLIVCDEENFDISKRFSLDCNNSDTVFFSKSSLNDNLDKEILKNMTILSMDEKTNNFKDSIFKNILNNPNYKIIYGLLSETDIKKIVIECTNDAFDFIKNKKFKENKENYNYLKKIIDNLKNNNLLNKNK